MLVVQRTQEGEHFKNKTKIAGNSLVTRDYWQALIPSVDSKFFRGIVSTDSLGRRNREFGFREPVVE